MGRTKFLAICLVLILLLSGCFNRIPEASHSEDRYAELYFFENDTGCYVVSDLRIHEDRFTLRMYSREARDSSVILNESFYSGAIVKASDTLHFLFDPCDSSLSTTLVPKPSPSFLCSVHIDKTELSRYGHSLDSIKLGKLYYTVEGKDYVHEERTYSSQHDFQIGPNTEDEVVFSFQYFDWSNFDSHYDDRRYKTRSFSVEELVSHTVSIKYHLDQMDCNTVHSGVGYVSSNELVLLIPELRNEEIRFVKLN